MKKTSTVRVNGNMIFEGHKLTFDLDLGDHWSCYCVLDEAGKIIRERRVATTPEDFSGSVWGSNCQLILPSPSFSRC